MFHFHAVEGLAMVEENGMGVQRMKTCKRLDASLTDDTYYYQCCRCRRRKVPTNEESVFAVTLRVIIVVLEFEINHVFSSVLSLTGNSLW